jgi:hypothetical protein
MMHQCKNNDTSLTRFPPPLWQSQRSSDDIDRRITSRRNNNETVPLMMMTMMIGFTSCHWMSVLPTAMGQCLSNEEFNNEFEVINGGPIPTEGSCCQFDVCGLTCPQTVSDPSNGTMNEYMYCSYQFSAVMIIVSEIDEEYSHTKCNHSLIFLVVSGLDRKLMFHFCFLLKYIYIYI